MRSIDLNGTWQLTFGPQGDTSATIPPPEWLTIPAQVPGNVELDLLAAGLLPAPLEQAHRIYETQKYETFQWWYHRVFKGDSALFPRTETGLRPVLVFDGLDCCATVILNGVAIGTADNMLIPHRFDLAEHLCLGENELLVRIDSPILAARHATPEPVTMGMPVNWESIPIRKAPHMYGWDIMPRIVSAGIWRDVRIELLPPTRFRNVYWTTLDTDPAGGRAEVLVDWDFATEQRDLDGWKVVVKLTRRGRQVAVQQQLVFASHGRARFSVAGAALWWPRGMGEAALHEATATLVDASGAVRDEHRSRIGLRTVRLERTDVTDEQGGEFVFRVNGEKLFAKGTNWVPLDALHSRDRQHLDAATAMLADLNCNMVRCWGGNVYEDHPFFDRCDELGILVWQDFALACAVYPQDQAFCDAIRREAEAVVARFRNHPSLALWAGNNEIDECYRWTGFDLDPNTDRLSREVLPEVVRRLDPARPYL
ncbi:MAG: glycoside hydrolase family 2, partial [Armatimonadetes bacterium]|nr:glycoside hydrolase family 2 [Armatimonadota bacterium]